MVGSKLRRPLAGFTELKKPSRGLSSGAPLAGGNPAGITLEDTNGNAWYLWVDVTGALRLAPAGTVEPNPQTSQPSYDWLAAASAFYGTPFQKNITGVVDNTFTDVFTVTVPNSQESASLLVVTMGALGAGGAVGAGEAVASEVKTLSVARVAGVAVVGNLSSAGLTSNAAVAGAATITLTTQLSAITGAVGAANTFTLQVRVTKGSGSSAAHTANVLVFLYNGVATGISLS
jgi:hypothetical protein